MKKIHIRCPECSRGAIGIIIRDGDKRDEYGFCNYCYMIPNQEWISIAIEGGIDCITEEDARSGGRKAYEYDRDVRPPMPYLYNVQLWHDRCKYCVDMMFRRYKHNQKYGGVSE